MCTSFEGVYIVYIHKKKSELRLWDVSLVDVWSTVSVENAIMIHGRFVQTDEEFYLVNVYAPCDNGAKQPMG